MSPTRPDWIAVDWGTSHLRAWAMGPKGVLDHVRTPLGMAQIVGRGFEAALSEAIGPWDRAPVLACGMVGARQGWVEAPYTPVPCPPGVETVPAPTTEPTWQVRILGGVRQDQPHDVMRGEETQIAGLVAQTPKLTGVICLPGTHSKWVQMEGGEIFHFATFLTGELFSLLSTASTLRHGLAETGHDAPAFRDAVETALATPERVAQRLFGLRAEGLLADLDPVAARSRLSGLLIGLELAGAKPYWLGQDVTLVGEGALMDLYAQALAQMGLQATRHDGAEAVRAGLTAAWDARP